VLGAATNVGWNAFSISRSWQSLERQPFENSAFEELPAVELDSESGLLVDLLSTDAVLDDAEPGITTTGLSDGAASATAAAETAALLTPGDLSSDASYTTFMVVGSDEGNQRADAIILVLIPVDGSAPIMVSLPRDLYLPNRCTGGLTRINANFNGCGSTINGATLLSGAIQDFTGLTVDHFVLFTMDGFEQVIDAVGGVEICVEHPTRERGRFEFLPGCTLADGEQTLGWVRSRRTTEFVNGRWRTVPGVSDLTRNQRQQELLLLLAGKVATFSSPGDLARFAASLSDSFVLDDGLSLSDAIDLTWSQRSIDTGRIRRPTIPVRNYVTSGGAQVLLPTASFAEVLQGVE
jgi:LCP family protein required for cell wall assembly